MSQSWTPIFTPGSPAGTMTIGQDGVRGIAFMDENNGIVTLNAKYHVTNDGGATWSAEKYLNIFPVQYLSATNIIAGTDNGRIYQSMNGGLTFSQIGTTIVNDIRDIDFSGNFGVLADSYCKSAVTLDYGNTWAPISNTALCGNLTQLNCAEAADATTGYVAGNNNKFYKTTNAGLNWSAVSSATFGNVVSLSFVNTNLGYARTTSTIYKTTDGGSTWNSINANITSIPGVTSSQISAGGLLAIDANNLYVGGTGKLFKSTDGGTTFSVDYTLTGCSSCGVEKIETAGTSLVIGISASPTQAKIYKKANAITVTGIKVTSPISQFSLWPNPANETIQIQGISKNEIKSVKFFDALGKLAKEVNENYHEININELNTGIYFVQVNSEKGSSIKKFIKQ